MGEAVTGGRAKTLIVERQTGRVVGEVVKRFGNDFYEVPLAENLVALVVAAFKVKWLTSGDGTGTDATGD